MAEEVLFEARAFGDLDPRTLHDILRLRSDVFLLEQGITTEPDVDGLDPGAEHVVGRTAQGQVVATARLRPTEGGVKVERVVVARAHRGRGVGRALMEVVHARLGSRPAWLSAQVQQLRWYEGLGWRSEGAPFDEGGVLHRRMRRRPSP